MLPNVNTELSLHVLITTQKRVMQILSTESPEGHCGLGHTNTVSRARPLVFTRPKSGADALKPPHLSSTPLQILDQRRTLSMVHERGYDRKIVADTEVRGGQSIDASPPTTLRRLTERSPTLTETSVGILLRIIVGLSRWSAITAVRNPPPDFSGGGRRGLTN